MTASQDTEITLGTGKMLILFFGLVALCAVFFGMGFSLGKNSSKTTAGDLSPATTVSTSGVRPSAVKSGSNTPAPPYDLTFYKAVGQKDTNAQLTTTDAANNAPDAGSQPSPDKANPSDPTAAPPLTGYYVQVAAVSKPEDADALVAALKQKQYPAFATSIPPDKLVHVQVGPFTDIRDAEGMRAKLVGDGYNPILKK